MTRQKPVDGPPKLELSRANAGQRVLSRRTRDVIVGSQQRRELFLVGLATTWTPDECCTNRIVIEVQTHFLVAPFAAVEPDVRRQPGVDKKDWIQVQKGISLSSLRLVFWFAFREEVR